MAAEDLIRKKIRDAIKTRMQLITTDNGYYTSIGNNVTIKKINPYPKSDLSGINISDESETQLLTTEAEELEERSLFFRLSIILRETDPDKILQAIADVEKAINVDPTWGGLAIRTVPMGNSDEAYQEENIIRGVNINIKVEYRTLIFNAES